MTRPSLTRSLLLSLLAFVVPFSAVAGRDCLAGFQKLLNKSLAQKTPNVVSVKELKSRWGKSESVKEIHQKFSRIPIRTVDRVKRAPQVGSLAAQYPELEKIIDDLNTYMVDFDAVRSRYQTLHQQLPQRDWIRGYYNNRMELLRSATEEIRVLISKSHPQLAEQFSERLLTDLREWRADLEFGARRFDDQAFHDLMRGHVNQWRAKLTEMDVFFSLSGARKLSMKIGEDVEMMNRLKVAMKQHRERIQSQPQYRQQFRNRYADLFQTDYLKGQDLDQLSSDEMLDAIEKWIGSKEVDVVYEVQGRSIWLEVKNYNRPFTESMLKSSEGKKSILSQMSENRVILDFLGMNQETTLGFYSASGLSSDAQFRLRQTGIQVLGDR